MAYTKEFEKFVLANYSANYPYSVHREEASHWLSAFAKLVKEEAGSIPTNPIDVSLRPVEQAFTAICERFGLEGK